MGYLATGHVTMPDYATVGTGGGSAKRTHSYFTNDDAAAVETDGYFDVAADRFNDGDMLSCALDLDGTKARKDYIVTKTTGDVALTAAAA